MAARLLIDMFFAYMEADEFGGLPFLGAAGHGSLSQDLSFSSVTMTTAGYSNLVPAANPGQTSPFWRARTGQLFLAVAIGW